MDLIEKLTDRAGRRAMRKLEKEEDFVFLRKYELLQELSPSAFVYLYSRIIPRRYKKNELVFKEGTPGICLFMVKKGRVEIFSQGENPEESSPKTVFTVIGEGAMFGELSLIAIPYRASSARVLDHGAELLTLSVYDLNNLCEQFPRDGVKLMKSLTAIVARHLTEVDRQLHAAREEIDQLKAKLEKLERA